MTKFTDNELNGIGIILERKEKQFFSEKQKWTN